MNGCPGPFLDWATKPPCMGRGVGLAGKPLVEPQGPHYTRSEKAGRTRPTSRYPSGNGPSINVNGVPSPFRFARASTSQAIATS